MSGVSILIPNPRRATGMKDDVAELWNEIRGQLFGISSFFAPPAVAKPSPHRHDRTYFGSCLKSVLLFLSVGTTVVCEMSDEEDHDDGGVEEEGETRVCVAGIRGEEDAVEDSEEEVETRVCDAGISGEEDSEEEVESRVCGAEISGEEDDDDYEEHSEEEVQSRFYVAGIGSEVVEFVKGIAMRPELWMDFPVLKNCGNLSYSIDMNSSILVTAIYRSC